MNRRQKEVIKARLEDEKSVLKALEKNYTVALADIKKNIRELEANPLTQSKAYRIDFQKQLEKQIRGALDNLQGKNFSSVADYLNTAYRQAFLGTMYDLQGQGVPLILPLDENKILKAVQKTGDDIKLSTKLSNSTEQLKKDVVSELQRGLSTASPYEEIARNISNKGSADMNRAMRIARTEGHRVQSEATMDSLNAAKSAGADIVKQWDATLDGLTRASHAELDGQIRELDENFTCSAGSAPYPGGFGDPAQDCNCRCCLLQRARWAVEDETTHQKWNNETGGFIECSGYGDFKEKYLTSLKRGSIFNGEGYNPEDIKKAMLVSKANFVTTNKNNFEYDYGKAIESVKPIEGVYDIKAHGDYDGVKLFDTPVGADELAKVLLYRPDYHGETIRLLSCCTGKTVNGTCVAQELADELGVEVIAPDKLIMTDGKGWLHVGDDQFDTTGRFRVFSPKKV